MCRTAAKAWHTPGSSCKYRLRSRRRRGERHALSRGVGSGARHAGRRMVMPGLTIVADVKLTVVAGVLQPRPMFPLEHAMIVAAPGASLMPFDVATGGLGEPRSGRALRERTHDFI